MRSHLFLMDLVHAVRVNRFRTILSLLGIIIAVFGVTLLGSAAHTGRLMFRRELETFGLDTLWVYRREGDRVLALNQRRGTGLDNDDLDAIDALSGVAATTGVASIGEGSESVLAWSDGRATPVVCLAVDEEFSHLRREFPQVGRTISALDAQTAVRVCVLDHKVASELFGSATAAPGRHVSIRNVEYRVVGVLRKKDHSMINALGGAVGRKGEVLVPISARQRRLNSRELTAVGIQVSPGYSMDVVAAEVVDLLRLRHHGRFDYDWESMGQYGESLDRMMMIVEILGMLGVLSGLMIGGVGIMNTMMSNVYERTEEIAIRMAMGATPRDIYLMIVLEAGALGVLGGILGASIGAAFVTLSGLWIGSTVRVAWTAIALAVACAAVTGALAGAFPARRAAHIPPAEVLRSI